MSTLLDELSELDARHQEGRLSEYAYRREKVRLMDAYAAQLAANPLRGLDASLTRPEPATRDPQNAPARDGAGAEAPAIRRGAGLALDAMLLFVVGVAFSEVVAQFFGNGLPYHQVDGQLIYLPGPGLYALRALETSGQLGGQMLLAILLTPVYLVIPWGAYRALNKAGGVGQMVAGYTIALRYMVVSAVVAYAYLALFNDYTLDLERHIAIPGLIGTAVLGTVLAVVILLRRLAGR